MFLRQISVVAAVTAAVPAQAEWNHIPATGPRARHSHASVFDDARGELLIFGGYDGIAARNDTWSYDGARWTQLPSAGAPPARWGHGMAWDPTTKTAVMFGGHRVVSGTLIFDAGTWVWDSQTQAWSRHDTPGPPVRANHDMTWDPRLMAVILFGGDNERLSRVYSDMWMWSGAAWRQVRFANPGPWALTEFGMATDSTNGRVLISGSPFFGPSETWIWEGRADGAADGSWIGPLVDPQGPAHPQSPAMTFDPHRDRAILFGGYNPYTASHGGTWEWSGIWTRWSGQSTPPAPRRRSTMVFDSGNGRALLFGGEQVIGPGRSTLFGDLWEYSAPPGLQRVIVFDSVGLPHGPSGARDEGLVRSMLGLLEPDGRPKRTVSGTLLPLVSADGSQRAFDMRGGNGIPFATAFAALRPSAGTLTVVAHGDPGAAWIDGRRTTFGAGGILLDRAGPKQQVALELVVCHAAAPGGGPSVLDALTREIARNGGSVASSVATAQKVQGHELSFAPTGTPLQASECAALKREIDARAEDLLNPPLGSDHVIAWQALIDGALGGGRATACINYLALVGTTPFGTRNCRGPSRYCPTIVACGCSSCAADPGLAIDPNPARGGDTIVFHSSRGTPGNPVALVWTELGGVPVPPLAIDLGAFDPAGTRSSTLTVPMGVGGFDITFVTFALHPVNLLVSSHSRVLYVD